MSQPKPRYIPRDSQPITRNGVDAIVYASTGPQSGRPWAIGYIGKSGNHAFNFTFRTVERMEEYVNGFFDNVAHAQQQKAARHATQTAFKHGYKVGDILHYSWGYEQTNAEFYQIISTTPGTVTMRRIQSASVPGSEGFMSCTVKPCRDSFITDEPVIVKRPQPDGTTGPGYIKMEHGVATLHAEDKAVYSSWYA